MITSMSTSRNEDWIKVDLHIHTLDDPKDVIDYSAHQLLERAKQLGFGVLAITAQLRVIVRCFAVDDAFTDFQQRNVDGSASEIEDQNGVLLLLLVEPIGERGRGRLVDDPQHLQTGDLAGFLGRLPLGVSE